MKQLFSFKCLFTILCILSLSSCKENGTPNDDELKPTSAQITVSYMVQPDEYNAYDIQLTIQQPDGSQTTEALPSADWKKEFNIQAFPANVGYQIKYTLKSDFVVDDIHYDATSGKYVYHLGNGHSLEYYLYNKKGDVLDVMIIGNSEPDESTVAAKNKEELIEKMQALAEIYNESEVYTYSLNQDGKLN